MISYFHIMATMRLMNSTTKPLAVLKTRAIGLITRFTILLTASLSLLVSQTACTASSLPPYEAEYTTKMRGLRINSERKFVETGENTYKLSWSAKALWMRISEWSEFEIVDDTVRPIAYHYKRKGLGSDRPIHVAFDWENMQATGSKGEKTFKFALEESSLDRLSFQVQMQLDLINNNSIKEFNYRIANYNGLRDYKFNFEKEENLSTRLGDFNTLVFRRDKKDTTIRLWMAPQQFYLPLKVQQTGEDANTVVIKGWKSEKQSTEELAFNAGTPDPFDEDLILGAPAKAASSPDAQ